MGDAPVGLQGGRSSLAQLRHGLKACACEQQSFCRRNPNVMRGQER